MKRTINTKRFMTIKYIIDVEKYANYAYEKRKQKIRIQ